MAAQRLLVLLVCVLRIKAEGDAGSEEEGGYTAPAAPLPYYLLPHYPLPAAPLPYILLPLYHTTHYPTTR